MCNRRPWSWSSGERGFRKVNRADVDGDLVGRDDSIGDPGNGQRAGIDDRQFVVATRCSSDQLVPKSCWSSARYIPLPPVPAAGAVRREKAVGIVGIVENNPDRPCRRKHANQEPA